MLETAITIYEGITKAHEIYLQNPKYVNNRRQKRRIYQTEDLGKGVLLEMVSIPGGTFTMGSTDYDREKPPHSVTVQPF
ncbi:hypothetical protein THIOM_001562, partial [Candidatus Thiomargarita nelsonii]